MSNWRGVLAPLNTESGDGRMLVLGAGVEPPIRPLPLPLNAQRALGDGHDGGVVVGRITRVWVDGTNLMGEGDFDMQDPDAVEWVRRIRDGYAGGVSVDVDNVHMVEVQRDRDGNPIDMAALSAQVEAEPNTEIPEFGPSLVRTESWRLMGATLVSKPAFAESRVEVTDTAPDAPAQDALVGEFADAPGGRMPAGLHRYWTTGKGLARWATKPHPYTALVNALSKEIQDMTPAQIKGLAANLYHDVFGRWPGKQSGGKHSVQMLSFATEDPPAPDTEDVPEQKESEQEHTGGMIALVPTEQDAQRYAVDGGDPASELHVTLAYLGDDVTGWDDTTVAAVAEAVAAVAPPTVEGKVFGRAEFNAECAVYLVEAPGLADLAATMRDAVTEVVDIPEPSYDGFVPHMTAGWDGMEASALTESGTVRFDRLRVAVGGKYTDIPLERTTDALTAAGIVYDANHFRDPQLSGPTKLTVDEDGRLFGHIATWGTCHIGFPGKCVTPPSTAASYRYFHRGQIDTTEGGLAVGLLTMGTGHAELGVPRRSALAHYDNTGTQVAVIRCGEDAYGIWAAGHVVPGVSREQVDTLNRSAVSGDWRGINGNRELVAALVVNVPGFPIPNTEALVASGGRTETLLAAGIVVVDGPTESMAVRREHVLAAAQARVRAAVNGPRRDQLVASHAPHVGAAREVYARRRIMEARQRVAAALGEKD